MPTFLCSVEIDMNCNVNAFAVDAIAVHVCVYLCVSVVIGSSIMHVSFLLLM